MVALDVVHGLAQRPGRPTSRHRSGRPRYRDLDLADPDVQVYLRDTCVAAKGASKLRVRARNTICVLDVFETDYLAPRGLELPLSRRDFRRHFDTFGKSRVLLDGSTLDHWVGFDCDTGDPTWIRDRYTLNVRENADVGVREGVFKKWRAFAEERAKVRPRGATRAVVASDNEVMTALETNIVRNSAIAALISVGAAFVCVLALTGALFHTLLILGVVVWEMVLLVSFMVFALGWRIGIIEAISLSVFVGVSVDYVLHVDRAFRCFAAYAALAGPPSPNSRASPLACRLNQLRGALGEVGAPVFAAACTTFASAVFLLFCVILPFRKLGVMIAAHTALSCLAALAVLPALLLVVPQRRISPSRVDDDDTGAAFELDGTPLSAADPPGEKSGGDAGALKIEDDAAARKIAALTADDAPGDEYKAGDFM